MGRKRIVMQDVPDDCFDPDTADDFDLDSVKDTWGAGHWVPESLERVRQAILAAMPQPRIHPQSGDVLRRQSDRLVVMVAQDNGGGGPYFRINGIGYSLAGSLDPAEWEIITAAELNELFDKKRSQQ